MADMMTFPDTVEEFMEEYKLVDTEQVYTNGMELVPMFRMKQWFEHEKAQLSCEGTTSDLISRQAVIDAAKDWYEGLICGSVNGLIKRLNALPTAQPETAKRIVGKSRDGMTLWYQCDMCNEPVDEQDNYCRGCGRRLKDG